MIELDGVVYRYDPMVMQFDIAVEAGAFVAVIGPSGAGKSTLINLIAGFEAPESGRIRLDGRDRTEARPADRPVTTLFQDHNLFAHLSAGDNVGLGLHPRLRLSRADRARVAEALAEVGLAGLENRRPAALSGGERQRVALARSIVRERPILLLDEPFAALDPALRREMTALVDRLRRERGLTVVMVSHQLDEVMDVASRALFLHDGRIVADGPLRAMIEAPPTPEVARYVA
ncbi:MAG: thiamine ABC transporter ATP-binding protein [Alphaproteobacteria bacterium]|jgi:thiamine transport system ATP-binding protein|nr:thiamine ABC transporter ATP-binding protein [Alphaproteobacteria bacterium]